MKHRQVRIGSRFGKLTVKAFGYKKNSANYWECVCECGEVTFVRTADLNNGHSKSCGCLQKEVASKTNYKNGLGSHDRLYRIYHGMKARCYYKKHKSYKSYGERGIRVCDAWLKDVTVFRKWALENGYDDALSIDRIDVNGNYEPSNCRWVSIKAQSNNRTSNKFVEFNGERKTIAEWALVTGLPSSMIADRLRLKWSVEKTLTTPKLR
ncbi:hypothetical protein PJ311_00160 [Bacillus sp. CLL-7-23]|uniref:AP2 domain-containing protein n=1 Tax=Bacillus changyiensis TaxID=3004103 RepID=A0ABT4WYA4_9BACI|nr:hypothetical protein [Bacillus changyiensis]MDA7025020.1 hypothetical protein [Bacillus changyiensis]